MWLIVARMRDGLVCDRHRQVDPSASDHQRVDWHGRRSLRRRLHRPAAAEEKMTQDELKCQVAAAALKYAQEGVIGVGSGSTLNCFIHALATINGRIEGAVAASEA